MEMLLPVTGGLAVWFAKTSRVGIFPAMKTDPSGAEIVVPK
jgi:hypothetical protein